MWNCRAHLLVHVKNFPGDAYLPERPRKSLKNDFQFENPRILNVSKNWFYSIIKNGVKIIVVENLKISGIPEFSLIIVDF